MSFEAASVSELVSSIKRLLEDEFQEVMVQGEVTNLSISATGHWYFTLSDEDACLSCALFRGDALRNPLIRQLKDGDKVIVLGPLSVYQKRGSFQLIVKRLLPAGAGQLKLQFERLKAKLSAEGLFDLEAKRPVPRFPRRIAVITAEHGAALQDFLNVIGRRSLWHDILIIPALVQGEGAAKSLISGLKKAQEAKDVDVIVLTRGGGSLEDLWAFNDEQLVRAIRASSVPVISAVGHEVDYSLSDYAADLRAETPTAAAEILSQPQTELRSRLHYCVTHLRSHVHKLQQRLEIITHKFHPREMISLIREKVQTAQRILLRLRLHERADELIGLREAGQRLDEYQLRLQHAADLRVSAYSERVRRLEQVLRALNPSLVLKRGYSYVRDDNGAVVGSAKEFNALAPGTRVSIHFHDGASSASREH